MIQYIKDLIDDIKYGILMARYRRANINENLMRMEREMERDLDRQRLWNTLNTRMPDIETPTESIESVDIDLFEGYEYSSGRTGMAIRRKIDVIGKSIGSCTNYGDNTYIMIKENDDTRYFNFIYIDDTGISKHSNVVEIAGVDDVW